MNERLLISIPFSNKRLYISSLLLLLATIPFIVYSNYSTKLFFVCNFEFLCVFRRLFVYLYLFEQKQPQLEFIRQKSLTIIELQIFQE
jgi:hypothetical protein